MNGSWSRGGSTITVNCVITAFVFAAENKVRFVFDTTDVPLLVSESLNVHVWMIRVEDFSFHCDRSIFTIFDN